MLVLEREQGNRILLKSFYHGSPRKQGNRILLKSLVGWFSKENKEIESFRNPWLVGWLVLERETNELFCHEHVITK